MYYFNTHRKSLLSEYACSKDIFLCSRRPSALNCQNNNKKEIIPLIVDLNQKN